MYITFSKSLGYPKTLYNKKQKQILFLLFQLLSLTVRLLVWIFFLVEMRRIELLSENLFIPASPSADVYLNSLIKTLNVKLLYLVAPNP